MRNITYIKTLILALAMAIPLQAQSGPAQSCYARDYSAKHLAGQPKQVVDRINILFSEVGDDLFATMSVLTANQGHVRKSGNGGQWFKQYLLCYQNNNTKSGWSCDVDCNGGTMAITRNDGKILEFRTNFLLIGGAEACGGPVDLAEVKGTPVTYRLYRVADSECGAK